MATRDAAGSKHRSRSPARGDACLAVNEYVDADDLEGEEGEELATCCAQYGARSVWELPLTGSSVIPFHGAK